MVNAAHAAGLALVVIQVGSGLVYKAAQRGDKCVSLAGRISELYSGSC
jgi:hypothetical protein